MVTSTTTGDGTGLVEMACDPIIRIVGGLGIHILLGSSYYEDWKGRERFVTHDPLGDPVDPRPPWNQHTVPAPRKRNFDDKHSRVVSPRRFDGKDHLPLDTGGGPLARLWSTALERDRDRTCFQAYAAAAALHSAEKGIDIVRAVRSLDPCLPCGVHMYVGDGRTVKSTHVPTGLSGLAG